MKCHANKEEGEEAFVNMITPKDNDGRRTPYTTWLGMEGPKRRGWNICLTSSWRMSSKIVKGPRRASQKRDIQAKRRGS